jgi:hypothetical protein
MFGSVEWRVVSVVPGRRQEHKLVSYNSEVSIDRPAAQIFPYLLETTLRALGSDDPIEPAIPRDLDNGARLRVSFRMWPLKAEIGLQISEYEPGRKLGFKSYSGPISWKGEYTLAEDGTGATTVSQNGKLKFTGLWRLMQPIAAGQIRRGEVRELERLKKLIEATPALIEATPALAAA